MTDSSDCAALKAERQRLQAELEKIPTLPVDRIAELNRVLGELEETLKSTGDDLGKLKKEAEDKLKALDKQEPSLAKQLRDLLGKAGKAGETVSQFTHVLTKYLEVTRAAEEYYRRMEGSTPEQLQAFADYLDGLKNSLSDLKGGVGGVEVDKTALKVMQTLMGEFAKSVRAVAGGITRIEGLQKEQAAAMKEADELHRDVLKRVVSAREKLADRRRDLESQIAKLDAQIAEVCRPSEPAPYDVCKDADNRVNRAVAKADADPAVVAAADERSKKLAAYSAAATDARGPRSSYYEELQVLDGTIPLDHHATVEDIDENGQVFRRPPTVKDLFGFRHVNREYAKTLTKRLDRHMAEADRLLKETEAKEKIAADRLTELRTATDAWAKARADAVARIAAEEKWTAEDLETLRRCHPDIKEPPGHAMRTPARRWGLPVVAAIILATAAIIGIATATGGGSGGNSGNKGTTMGGQFADKLRAYLVGPPAKDLGAYWEGYAVSQSGCPDPSAIGIGPANTTAYAGTISMKDGLLHATGVEFSGDYTGQLNSDGSFRLATAPAPDQPFTIDAHITGYSNGVYPIAGKFSNVRFSNCVVTYVITAGHLDTLPGK